jgi:XTP/dITP diphosphohydrolase
VLPEQVVLASNNPGKLRELTELLADLRIRVRPQGEFNVPEAEETGLSFVENAILKARNAARHARLPAIADDSGIEVEFLSGAPGIYSARYAGIGATDAANLQRLIEQIKQAGFERPAARYQCVIVYMTSESDATPLIAHGTWHGCLVTEPRGGNGFGYDPIFYVPSYGCTAAELPPAEKNRVSHRGQAMQDLARKLTALRGGAY